MNDWKNYNNPQNNTDKVPNFIILEENRGEDLLLPSIVTKSEKNIKNKKNKLWSNFKLATLIVFIAISGVTLGAGFGAGYALVSNIVSNNQVILQQPYVPAHNNLALTTNQTFSMVNAVEIVKPAVVSIDTVTLTSNSSLFISPFFERESERPSSGTGIVFYEDEINVYIVTNEHVIENAVSIEVSFAGSMGTEAFILGRDIRSDIAVLYVPKLSLKEIGVNDITIAEFGNSSDMQVGEFVMAIGNALGQGIITTMGVVSATDMQISVQGRLLTVLQTDAAINPGNSGGPLINSRGQVIGINTVKLSRNDVYGMGYSITSNVVVPIIDGLMNETARPTLGISGYTISEINAQNRQNLGIAIDYGVLVGRIHRGSGADKAGLREMDIITHFNGKQIYDMEALRDFIFSKEIGQEVEITILRDGDTLSLSILLILF